MSNKIECICGKTYSNRSSLCVHRKKCSVHLKQKQETSPNINTPIPDVLNQTTLLFSLINNLLQPIQKQLPVKTTSIEEPEFCLDTFLNKTCKDAYNFDDIFIDYIFNGDYNNWLINVDNGKEEFTLLKYLHIYSYPRGSNFYVDFFCEAFNKIDHIKKPIFCSDSKRNIYYIKNKNKWSKIHYTELINKIYRKIANYPLISMNYIFSRTLKKISEKQFYKLYPNIKDFNEIKEQHYDKLTLNFCDSTPDSFLHKCNLALKKITNKNQAHHISSPLDAMTNEIFTDEPDKYINEDD